MTIRRAIHYVGPATVLLLSAAIYNGYPLAFPDSGDYIHAHHTPMRTPFYAMLTRPLQYTGSAWSFVVMHAAIVAYLIYRTAGVCQSGWGITRFLSMVALLTVLSSVSWYVSYLMPDIFSAIAVLSLFLILCASQELAATEQAFVFVLLLAACLVHMSVVPVALGLWAVIVVLRATDRFKINVGRLALSGAVILGSLGLQFWHTATKVGVLAPTAAGYVHPLATLARTGQLKLYLDEVCETEHYRICPFRDDLPERGDEFIWSPKSPVHRLGGFVGYREEGSRLVLATIRHQPWKTVETIVRTAVAQVGMFNTAGYSFGPMAQAEWPTRHFEAVYPREIEQYRASRQNRQDLPFPRLARIHEFFVIGCLAVVLALGGHRWKRTPEPLSDPMIVLICVVLLALVITASTAGFLGGQPSHRYMARVIWLLPLTALLGLLGPSEKRRSGAG